MLRACAVMPQVASRPIRPRTWSPCMCVIRTRVTWLMFRSLRSSWCCVPSPQSKSQTSARCGGLKATHETLRARVGDADARARGRLFVGGRRVRLFEPDAAAEQVFAVKLALDAERLAELARPVGQLAVFAQGPAHSHQLDALDGFDGAHEHGV